MDLEACTIGVGAGLPANTGVAGAMYRVAFFAGEPAPTGGARPMDLEACTIGVGAGLPANTGVAGAM